MIYVDPMMSCVPNGRWKWTESCHLFTEPGDLEDLHGFAARIGLRQQWCQWGSVMVHYDLNPALRIAAVEAGAVEIGRRKTGELIRAWREWRANTDCDF